MGLSFKGLVGKVEEASVKRATLVEEGKIAPTAEVRIAMDARIDQERKTGLRTAEQIAVIEDYEHTGAYHVQEGGTYTQTHPGLMNPTEFMFWKRKQAGLGVNVAPAQRAKDEAAIERTFGMPSVSIPRPRVTPLERQESEAESKAISYKAATARSVSVDADEYIAHHAEHFGTKEAKSLGAGLHNLYSDDYEVLTPKEGVNVVVNSGKDEVFVISDAPLGAEEKLGYAREIDRAGDTPNRPIFIEGGGAGVPIVSSGGGALPGAGTSMLLAVVAAVAVVLYFMTRGRK